MKRLRIACTVFVLALSAYNQISAQSETYYDIEHECICLVDSIAADTIIQFWRFTQANNPGSYTVDVTYDFSSSYTPRGTLLSCSDYYFSQTLSFDTLTANLSISGGNTVDLDGVFARGQGTATTLPIWSSWNTLGNSSMTEASQVLSSSLTGAMKMPSGTLAQRPAGVAGQLRYTTTGLGFEGYNGSSFLKLPWADTSKFANTRIPYSDGSKLTSSSNFKWTGGLNIGNVSGAAANWTMQVRSDDIIFSGYNSSGTERIRIAQDGQIQFQNVFSGQGIYWGSYALKKEDGTVSADYRGLSFDGAAPITGADLSFTIRNGGNVAFQAGHLEMGTFNYSQSLYGVAIDTLYGVSATTPLLISGFPATYSGQSSGGSITIRGGQSVNTNSGNNGGSLLFTNGNMGTSGGSNALGFPGVIEFKVYRDTNAINVPGNLYKLLTMDYNRNIRLHNLRSYTTLSSIAVLDGDTIKTATPANIVDAGRPRAYAEMYIDDTDPDTIAYIGGGTTPAEGTDWTDGDLANWSYSAGRLTYTGSETAKFLINTSVSFSFAEGSTDIEAWVYKNNSEIPGAEFHRKIGTGGDVGNAGHVCIVELALNDYIEIFFAPVAHTGDDNLIIQNANVSIIKL